MVFDNRFPMIDLHRHLDGNIRIKTILDLADQFRISLPATTERALRPHVQVMENQPNLVSFLKKLDWGVRVLGSLDACHRVALENVEDVALAGIQYVELRFSPAYMAKYNRLPVPGVIEAVIDGVKTGCQRYGVVAKLIGTMSRTFGEYSCLSELNELILHRDNITAIDLAGDEISFPGKLFVKHFKKARDAGFRITVHAGEASGSESVWQALLDLGAERIGHGVRAIEDRELVDFLAKNSIGIESCLTSNVQTNTISSLADHPIRQFLEHGVLATINTDDPSVQGIDLSHEYDFAAPRAGLNPDLIRKAQENSLTISFLDQSEKSSLCKRAAAN